MILPADQARRIQRGDRSTIRVPVDPRLMATPLRPATRSQSKPFCPSVGDLLPIAHPIKRLDEATRKEKDGWETICHATAIVVYRAPLGVLTDEQANAEGYETTGEFVQAWTQRHDGAFLDRQVAHLIEAGTDPEEAEDTREEWAKVRYRDRWQNREVWVLTVKVEHDMSRFLAPAGRPKGSEHGYVIGGGDPLDAGVVQPVEDLAKKWSRRAARRQLEAIAENASPEERSRRARALARRVRELALQDPRLARQIEELVRDAEKKAA